MVEQFRWGTGAGVVLGAVCLVAGIVEGNSTYIAVGLGVIVFGSLGLWAMSRSDR